MCYDTTPGPKNSRRFIQNLLSNVATRMIVPALHIQLGCPDSGQEIPQTEVLPVGGQEACQSQSAMEVWALDTRTDD